MSKAFTRESDDAPEEPLPPRPAVTLPPGAKNYVAPDGAARWREELERLTQAERPPLTTATDDDSRQRLRTVDHRIARLQQNLGTAVVVPPPATPEERERVKFGATVTVRERSGELVSYRIVGADETDLDRGWVSWLSPIAKALMNARTGERVRFKFPAGEEELEIVSVGYEAGE
jgi:transcription elongation factor GreB